MQRTECNVELGWVESGGKGTEVESAESRGMMWKEETSGRRGKEGSRE